MSTGTEYSVPSGGQVDGRWLQVSELLTELAGRSAADGSGSGRGVSLMCSAVLAERARSLLDLAAGALAVDLEASGATVANFGLRVDGFLAHAPSLREILEGDTRRGRNGPLVEPKPTGSDGDVSNDTDNENTSAPSVSSVSLRQAKAGCRRRVRVARSLRFHFAEFFEAILDGSLSWSHAEVLERVANPRNRDTLASIQSELIAMATCQSFASWEKELQGLARLIDQDGGYDPSSDPTAQHLDFKHSGLGTELRGNLNDSGAQVVRTAIERVTEELWTRYRQDIEQDPDLVMPSRKQLHAEALIELCRRAQAVDVASSTPARTQATLVINHDDLISGRDFLVTNHTGDRFPFSNVEELCCDQHLEPIVMDDSGNPLKVGRNRRLATASQRRALLVRDGGCVFPGCDVPHNWCVTHHVVPWHQGGPTDLDNLATLCHHHHSLTHSTGWAMKPHPGEHHFTWTTPTGRTLHSQHNHTQDKPRR